MAIDHDNPDVNVLADFVIKDYDPEEEAPAGDPEQDCTGGDDDAP